jgi:hypothetical protein
MKKVIILCGLFCFVAPNLFSQCVECGTGAFIGSTTGNGAITIGNFIENSGTRSIIIGEGYSEQSYLSNSAAHRILFGLLSTKPTLVIWESPFSPLHDKTGSVTIGDVAYPQAKLHLKSDDDKSASLFLEPSNWTAEFNAELFLGNLSHGISAEIDKGLVFKTEKSYLFNQGNMGIGTEEPAAKVHVRSGDIYIEDIERGIIMKSPDGTCWRGTINNQGQLIFESLNECPEDAMLSVKESTSNQMNIRIHPNPAINSIEIEIPKLNLKSLELKMIDETGNIVKSLKIISSNTTVNIADLAPGLYFCNFLGENNYYVEKIIKN